MQYSFKKGLNKGIVSVLTILVAVVSFAGFSDLEIWNLLEQYVKPVVGSLTIGGALTMALNYFKVKRKEKLLRR